MIMVMIMIITVIIIIIKCYCSLYVAIDMILRSHVNIHLNCSIKIYEWTSQVEIYLP